VISRNEQAFQINGVASARPTLTASCVDDFNTIFEFQVMSESNGRLSTVKIECDRPEHFFTVALVGFVPFETRTLISTEWATMDTSIVMSNYSSDSDDGSEPLPSHPTFTLLRDDANLNTGNYKEGYNNMYVTCRGCTPETARYSTEDLQAASCIAVMAGAAAESIGRFADCFAGSTIEQYNAVMTKTNQTRDAFDLFAQSVEQTGIQFARVTEALNSFNQNIYNYSAVFNQTLDNGQSVINGVSVNQNIINQQLADGLIKKRQVLNETLLSVAVFADQLAGIAQTDSAQFTQLSAYFAQLLQQMIQNFADFTTTLVDERQEILTPLYATQQALVDLTTTLQRIYLLDGVNHRHNAKLQKIIQFYKDTPTINGRMIRAFVDNEGTVPKGTSNMPSSIASRDGADYVIRYVSSDTRGYTTRLTYRCSSAFMSQNAPSGASWNNLLNYLGPVGCDPTFSSSKNNCKCVMIVREQSCPLSPTLTSSQLSLFRSIFETEPLVLTSQIGCITPATKGSLDGQVLYHVGNVSDFIASIGRRGVFRGSTYQWAELQTSFANEAVYYESMLDPSLFSESMYADGVRIPSDSLSYSIMKDLPIAFQAVFDRPATINNYIYGLSPLGLTHQDILYHRYSSGAFGTRGTKAIMAMLSMDDFATVSTLIPSSITTNVRYSVDGNETVISDVIYNQPQARLLPLADETMIWSPDQFSTAVCDMDSFFIQPNPYPYSRRHHPLYTITTDPTTYSKGKWETQNGFEFDHSAAGFSPHASFAPLDSDRRCSAPSMSGVYGKSCFRRNSFDARIVGVFDDFENPGTMVFSPRGTTGTGYTFTIPLPGNEIVQFLDSGCPSIARLSQSINQLNIAISNPLGSVNEIQVIQLGECPSTTTITINARETYDFTAFVCPTAPSTTPDRLRFAYLNNGTYTLCPGPIVNLTLVSSQTGERLLPPTVSYVLESTGFAASSMRVATEDIRSSILNVSHALLFASLTSQATFGWGVPRPAQVSYDQYTDKLIQLSANAQTVAGEQYRKSQEFKNTTYGLAVSVQSEFDRFSANIDALDENYRRSVILAKNVSREINIFKDFALQQIERVTDLANALGSWIQTVSDSVQSALSTSGSQWFEPPGDLPRSDSCSSLFKSCAWESFGGWTAGVGGLGNDIGRAFLITGQTLGKIARAGIGLIPSIPGLFGSLGGILTIVAIVIVILISLACMIQCSPMLCRNARGCKQFASNDSNHPLSSTDVSPSLKDMRSRISRLSKKR
jgi:hypothetical protein